MDEAIAKFKSHISFLSARYPTKKFVCLFDIDGSLIDSRYAILHLLSCYDRCHHTEYFQDLSAEDLSPDMVDLKPLINELATLPHEQDKIWRWCKANRWCNHTLEVASHVNGEIFELLRWIQTRPGLEFGLNSGRGEEMRLSTLRTLNQLGMQFGVKFRQQQLCLNPFGHDRQVLAAKWRGIRFFNHSGSILAAIFDSQAKQISKLANNELPDTLFVNSRCQSVSQRIVQDPDRYSWPTHAVNMNKNLNWHNLAN